MKSLRLRHSKVKEAQVDKFYCGMKGLGASQFSSDWYLKVPLVLINFFPFPCHIPPWRNENLCFSAMSSNAFFYFYAFWWLGSVNICEWIIYCWKARLKVWGSYSLPLGWDRLISFWVELRFRNVFHSWVHVLLWDAVRNAKELKT